jgi:pyrimidine-nucleoside phosphorylase
MNIIDIINKKRNNYTLNYDELYFAFNGYLQKEVADYQMSALLMAITINGLSFDETLNLTKIFINSGEVYHFHKKVCDKHSTGGIGDTATFIVAPILASLDIPIAKMSGRGLGITGGTIDKLESIPGFNVNLTKDDYLEFIDKVNIAIGSQTDNLVPLDKVIYALRDVTGTTDCLGLIASSIMSKKIACGASFIAIDIKCGEGALIKNKNDADELSKWLIKIGDNFNVSVKTVITDMDEPLSSSVGNALEVIEAIEVLKGKKCKLRDVSIELAGTLISMYKNISLIDAKNLASNSLDNNAAYNAFVAWISNQGGDLSKIKVSDKVFHLKSSVDGTIEKISALACGKLALKLGSGRQTKNSSIDYGVGIKLLKQNGEEIKKGDILADIYVNDENIKLTNEDLNIFKIEEK